MKIFHINHSLCEIEKTKKCLLIFGMSDFIPEYEEILPFKSIENIKAMRSTNLYEDLKKYQYEFENFYIFKYELNLFEKILIKRINVK